MMPAACDLFKTLSEPTRLRILHLLSHGPLCVCHIHEILDLPQSKVSQQLGNLRKAALVATSRYHNWTLYSLPEKSEPVFAGALATLKSTAFSTDPIFKADLKRLRSTDTSAACEAAAACC